MFLGKIWYLMNNLAHALILEIKKYVEKRFLVVLIFESESMVTLNI